MPIKPKRKQTKTARLKVARTAESSAKKRWRKAAKKTTDLYNKYLTKRSARVRVQQS